MRISKRWLALTLLMVAVIWGNSLVPGEGSSGLSMQVTAFLHAVLGFFGLPSAWLTNFMVRKAAHFTEYAVLGVLASHAFDPERERRPLALIATAVFLVVIPSVDETLQLSIPGRVGAPTDVMIDCCGAATGVVLRYLAGSLLDRRRRSGEAARAA